MKNIVILFILLLLNCVIYAQKTKNIKYVEYQISVIEKQIAKADGAKKVMLLAQLGELYLDKDPNKTIEIITQNLKSAKKEKVDNNFIASMYNSLGAAYFYLGKLKKSVSYYEDEYALIEKTGTPKKRIESLFNIGIIYYKLEKESKAEKYYKNALDLALQSNSQDHQMLIYKGLYELYASWGKHKDALNSFLLYLSIKDAQFNFETQSKIGILRSQYQFERRKREKTEQQLQETDSILTIANLNQELLKRDTLLKSEQIKSLSYEKQLKETELELKQKDIELKDQKVKNQQVMISGILIILLVIAGFIVWLLLLHKKLKHTNSLLYNQKDEIEIKNRELEAKNAQIMDSINYALKIQQAILIPEHEIQRHLPECFIFYEPKDVVSGDFYWFSKIEHKYIIAAIDCTGHGVPGAFMSMIGNTLLNEIVNEKLITKPDEILAYLHSGVSKALQQNKDMEAEDGMDMSLCTIDVKLKRFQYAGAKNSIYVIQGEQLKVLKANYHSIGGKPLRAGQEIKFTSYDFMYDSNTSIYMMSDGYLDQFGGLEDTKFNSHRFKQMLLDNHKLPMIQQKAKIKETLWNWKGEREQVDDILVMGIKLD